jgi:hypothetical protein
MAFVGSTSSGVLKARAAMRAWSIRAGPLRVLQVSVICGKEIAQ